MKTFRAFNEEESVLEKAYYGALDNELADDNDPDAARLRVLQRISAYADNYGLDKADLLAYALTQASASTKGLFLTRKGKPRKRRLKA